MEPPSDVARYVHVTNDYDVVLAAWARLGFAPVPGWSRGLRSTLFRAGPTFVELVDGAALGSAPPERPGYAAAVAISGR